MSEAELSRRGAVQELQTAVFYCSSKKKKKKAEEARAHVTPRSEPGRAATCSCCRFFTVFNAVILIYR